MPIFSTFQELISSFFPVMTAPTFQNFLMITQGWLLSRGRRTITELIQQAGAVGKKHHSVYHRFFSRAQWLLDDVSWILLTILLKFHKGDVVFLAADDTLCRKYGLHIFGTCMHHDPLISCRRVSLVNWGHNWVVAGIIIEFPFAPGIIWCLPFAFRLYISRKRAKSQRWKYKGVEHKTRPELLAEMHQKVSNWFPDRVFHVVTDSAYGGKSVLKVLPKGFHLTSRMPMSSRLYKPPKSSKKRGRPWKKGKPLPTPAEVAENKRWAWKTLRLVIYGKKKKLKVKEYTGLWKSSGWRPIKVVVVRDPEGKVKDQTFFTTDIDVKAQEILMRYSKRWSIEVAFENTKSHFGFEDPQNWTRRAVERTAPMTLVLYSLVIAWFAECGHKRCEFPNRPWCLSKRTPSFVDILSTYRKETVREYFLNTPKWNKESRKIIRFLIGGLRIAV